jgi:hypothetical protein
MQAVEVAVLRELVEQRLMVAALVPLGQQQGLMEQLTPAVVVVALAALQAGKAAPALLSSSTP